MFHTYINIGTDCWPKGSGTVIFETAKDAQQTIKCVTDSSDLSLAVFMTQPGMYNGFNWYGRILGVRASW